MDTLFNKAHGVPARSRTNQFVMDRSKPFAAPRTEEPVKFPLSVALTVDQLRERVEVRLLRDRKAYAELRAESRAFPFTLPQQLEQQAHQ